MGIEGESESWNADTGRKIGDEQAKWSDPRVYSHRQCRQEDTQ